MKRVDVNGGCWSPPVDAGICIRGRSVTKGHYGVTNRSILLQAVMLGWGRGGGVKDSIG